MPRGIAFFYEIHGTYEYTMSKLDHDNHDFGLLT